MHSRYATRPMRESDELDTTEHDPTQCRPTEGDPTDRPAAGTGNRLHQRGGRLPELLRGQGIRGRLDIHDRQERRRGTGAGRAHRGDSGTPTRHRLHRPSRPQQWAGLAFVGVFGGAVAFLLFFEGLARASSTDAAFLHKTLLVWVALLALPLLGERLSGMHIAAIALLVIGQIGLAGGATTLLGQGQLMVLGATLIWAFEVVVAKRLLADLSSWTVGLTRMVAGSVVLIAWTLLRGKGGALTALTGTQWMWVLLTGLILAGYVSTWFAALSRAPAVDVTAVLVVGAVITALLAAGVKGSPLVPQLGWLALIIVGTGLAALPGRLGRDTLAGVG